jgi:hypothetical protein
VYSQLVTAQPNQPATVSVTPVANGVDLIQKMISEVIKFTVQASPFPLARQRSRLVSKLGPGTLNAHNIHHYQLRVYVRSFYSKAFSEII